MYHHYLLLVLVLLLLTCLFIVAGVFIMAKASVTDTIVYFSKNTPSLST
jgi:hypothetical protein